MATMCPECDNLLDVDTSEIEEGETVTCDECGTELEVVSTEPLHLTVVDGGGYDDEDENYGKGYGGGGEDEEED